MSESNEVGVKILQSRFKTLMKEANTLEKVIETESKFISETSEKVEEWFQNPASNVEDIEKIMTEDYLERATKFGLVVEYTNYLRHALLELERMLHILGESVTFETEEDRTKFLQLKTSTSFGVIITEGTLSFTNETTMKEEVKAYLNGSLEKYKEHFKAKHNI